jgi:hypothetical protein
MERQKQVREPISLGIQEGRRYFYPIPICQKQKENGKRAGGEGGIRTPDSLSAMSAFEAGAFNHSATSPMARDLYRE